MDDQQARNEAAAAVDRLPWGAAHGGIDPTADAIANAAIDAYLAALPVAPEQPTQTNEVDALVTVLRANLAGERAAAYAQRDPQDYEEQIEGTDEVVDMIAALVLSPSVETVTPDREAIIREVINWMVKEGMFVDRSDARFTREHFGVSS